MDPRWLDFDGGVRCDDPTGCLLLSHDPILAPLHHAAPGYYSHLDDVLIVLSDVEPVRSVARREGLRIALCFKGVPRDVCGGNSTGVSLSRRHAGHGARWLRKVDAFVEAAKSMLAAQGLEDNIEFVLDGGGVPVDCLAQRWRPWRSVYMNGTAPAEAFVSDVARDGLDRFQLLNEPADLELWKRLADPSVDYGKFSSGTYPYQLWEPGAQAAIQALVEVFQGGRPHAPGLDFASNSDSAMFQVYAGLGLNQPLRQHDKLREEEKGGEGDVGGLVTIVKPGLVLILLDRRRAEYRAYAFDPTQPLSSSFSGQKLRELERFSSLNRLMLPGMEEGKEERAKGQAIQTLTAVGERLLVSTAGGDYFIYDIEGSNVGDDDGKLPLLTLRQTGSFSSTVSSSIALTATARRRSRVRRRTLTAPSRKTARISYSSALLPLGKELDNSNTTILLLELYMNEDWQQEGCRLAYQVQRRQSEGQFEDDKVITDGCLWRRADDEAAEGEEAAEGWDVQSAVAVPVQHGGGEVVLVFASAAGKVYMTEVSSVHVSSSPPSESCMVQIGVGRSVAASAAAMARPRRKKASTVVMLVSGDGFCFNSHLHNTGPFNVCRLTPHATPGVLDYTYGSVIQWLQVLRGTCAKGASISSSSSSSTTKSRLVTACDADLLHGSYDLGHHPSVALFPTSMSGSNRGVGMLEVHRGFTEDCPVEPLARLLSGDYEDDEEEEKGRESEVTESGPRHLQACECGPALVRPKGSLVADSFPLQLGFV